MTDIDDEILDSSVSPQSGDFNPEDLYTNKGSDIPNGGTLTIEPASDLDSPISLTELKFEVTGAKSVTVKFYGPDGVTVIQEVVVSIKFNHKSAQLTIK